MSGVSRRGFLRASATTAAGVGLIGAAGTTTRPGHAHAAPSGYLVGAGKGRLDRRHRRPGNDGLLRHGRVANGLLQRTWARAFIIADAATGKRVLFITADLACVFTSHHSLLLAELAKRYGDTYNLHNVNISDPQPQLVRRDVVGLRVRPRREGHRHNSLVAEMAGLLDAVEQAHNSLAPAPSNSGTPSCTTRVRTAPSRPSSPTRCRSAPLPCSGSTLRSQHCDCGRAGL